jgi:hypothetical protein
MSTPAEEEDSASGTTQLDLKQKQRKVRRKKIMPNRLGNRGLEEEEHACDGRSPVPECRAAEVTRGEEDRQR